MNAMMRAAVYHALDDIRLEDRPVPEIGPGEVLLKTLACGLCGGETMAWYKRPSRRFSAMSRSAKW
nr:hypothetical protein [Marinicella sp. W31]MDC2879977.1 hypothetical protein [Marinicella sp. W31]